MPVSMRPSRPPLGIFDANYTLAPLYSSFPAALTSSSPSFPSLQDQDTSVSAYPSMGPGKYPRNVSFWHNPPAQPQPPLPPTAVATSYPSVPPMLRSLLQPTSDQKKPKRT
ncbi:hypothetical protein ACMYSQ_008033 [Aspergillus niger]